MDPPVYHSIMSMENEYPTLKSPEFIEEKLLPPFCAPVKNVTCLSQNVTLCYISGTKRLRMLIFSVNNYDGTRSITLKNDDNHSIRMGGVRGRNPPHPKILI